MVKCGNCGKEMDYIDIRLADTNLEEKTIYVEEIWECLECENREVVGITGKITEIDKWKR